MSKPRSNELIAGRHFTWRLVRRDGVWYADGRSNSPNPGRHSLGTRDHSEAIRLLAELDALRAVELGLADRAESPSGGPAVLFEDGRTLVEDHLNRPRAIGGVRPSTAKRYRAHFDNFSRFCELQHIETWNAITDQSLERYAKHLEGEQYHANTISKELRLVKQATNWLIKRGHLAGKPLLVLAVKKIEGQRAYCWRPEEFLEIVEYCRQRPELHWLHNVVITLGHTGLRISELCALQWSDVDLTKGTLRVADETGRATANRRTTKAGKTRLVPVHPRLREILENLPRTGRHVLLGPRGGRLKPDTVRRLLVRYVLTPLATRFPADEGEPGFIDGRLHSFRHFFVSECAARGLPERYVMDWVGHADSAMVRHYFHANDAASQAAMGRLDFLDAAGGRSAETARDSFARQKENARAEAPESRETLGNGP